MSKSVFVAAFATVLMLGGGTAQAVTCNVPGDHGSIQAAVDDPACDTINVAAGGYAENVMIPRSVTLNGAQANTPVAGRMFGPPFESTITGMIANPAPDITIQAAGVTINGFSLSNLGQATGILIKTAGNNALITNNIIEGIGGASFGGNTQAIYLENGPDNVTVVGNRIRFVEGILTSNGGIFIGDSTASFASVDILIEGNTISDIHSVNRGAYAIHVDNGASSAPSATGFTTVTIRNNTISNLVGGGWTHAIGLEGDTPGVLVVGNDISNLVAPSDAVAVWFEDNPSPLGRQRLTKTTSTSPWQRMGSQFTRPSSWRFRTASSTALATGGIRPTGQAQSVREQAPGLPPTSTTPLGSSRPPRVGHASAAYPPLPGR